MKQILCLTIFLCLSLAVRGEQDEQAISGWYTYKLAHSGFELKRSKDAQNGFQLAAVDNTRLEFPAEFYSFYRDFRPQGFLYQTIAAHQYRGKHLHISAFARHLAPNFGELEKWFDVEYAKYRQRTAQSDIETRQHLPYWWPKPSKNPAADFAAHIRDSYRNSRYEVWVLLHRAGQYDQPVPIEVHVPTSTGSAVNAGLWHRFNVEVSVPEDCTHLTVMFNVRGVVKTEVDHFALVEHGRMLPNQRRLRSWHEFEGSYELLSASTIDAKQQLINPGFEN